MKSNLHCMLCGQTISHRIVGHSDVLHLCWKHDVDIKSHYGADYHLNPERIIKDINEFKEKMEDQNEEA